MGLLSNDQEQGRTKRASGCFEIGLIAFFLCFVILVIVGALASTPLLAFGIRGFINLEDCAIGEAHSLDAFNFLSGSLFVLVLVVIVLVPIFMFKIAYSGNKLTMIIYRLITFLLILTMIVGIGDIAYSFYIASQVYDQLDEFQQGRVNCSSPVYYSSFVSAVIVHLYIIVEIGLAVVLYIWLIVLPAGK